MDGWFKLKYFIIYSVLVDRPSCHTLIECNTSTVETSTFQIPVASETTAEMAALSDRFNLKKQFVFYASYHNDPINVVIHLICIWPIFATFVVFLQVDSSITQIRQNSQQCLQERLYGWCALLMMINFILYFSTHPLLCQHQHL